jgi:hypothetical protein
MNRYLKVVNKDGTIKYYEENKYKDVFDFDELAKNFMKLDNVISVEFIIKGLQ